MFLYQVTFHWLWPYSPLRCGNKWTDSKSKTEAIYFQPPGKTATTTSTADIIINEFNVFSYTDKFKYLGTIFTLSLKDDLNIQRQITQANGAFATMKRFLCNEIIPVKLRVWLYDAVVINILLWGCESWALTAELQRKLEVCHHRFLRKMIGITIYDVRDLHHISNRQVREELTCYTIHQSLIQITKSKIAWKLALMSDNRGPKNALQSWIYNEPRKHGGQQQHIKTSLSNTIIDSLHFDSDKMNDWMLEAKEPKIWANQIETALNLIPNTNTPFKLRRW